MPFGFGSVYGNGGQNAIYTADFGGAGGPGGGGGSLNAQMRAMANFDPSAMMNTVQENAYTHWLNQASLADAIKQSDRTYAEKKLQEDRNRQGRQAGKAGQYGLGNQDPLAGPRQRAQLAMLQAQSGTAPMRFVNPLLGQAHWTMDPNRMTGAQRQAFLPGGNTLQPSTSRMEVEGLRSDANFANQLAADRSVTGGSAATLPSRWAPPDSYPGTASDPRWGGGGQGSQSSFTPQQVVAMLLANQGRR